MRALFLLSPLLLRLCQMVTTSPCWRCSPGLGDFIFVEQYFLNQTKSNLVTSPCQCQRVLSSPGSSWTVSWPSSISSWPPSHGSPSGQSREQTSPCLHQMMTTEQDHYCQVSSVSSPHYWSFSRAQDLLIKQIQTGPLCQSQVLSSPGQKREWGEQTRHKCWSVSELCIF